MLAHMRAGPQSLARKFIHSFVRRDYTAEELKLDRALRKHAGGMSAREGKLAYIDRDFDIIKLRAPSELSRLSVFS